MICGIDNAAGSGSAGAASRPEASFSPRRAFPRIPAKANKAVKHFQDFTGQPGGWRWLGSGVLSAALLASIAGAGAAAPPPATLTNAASVRELTTDQAEQRLPVNLRGVVTFSFDTHSCFVQDDTAGIYVGNGEQFAALTAGDVVVVEGVSGPGDYAPIVKPVSVRVVGHTHLPPARRVSYEDLMAGREDSQWVEVEGLVRAAQADPASQQILEIATGGGTLTAFVTGSSESNLVQWVDSQVRVRGVCGTWFNKLRQLFGVRLMVPRPEDVLVVEPAATNALVQPAQPIGSLLRFTPRGSHGHRVKVIATVVLHQPGRALFVQDDQHGLYVQARQTESLRPGDRVEVIGFPGRGEYTPMLQAAVWRKLSAGPEPEAVQVRPDEALGGLQDCRLVSIEGRLLDHTHNNNETVLVLEAEGRVFSAYLESADPSGGLAPLETHSRLRLTGVCRIEVGEDWRAGAEWRAKAFRIVLRSPADVRVLSLPPWWTLTRLLWAVGILAAVVLVSLTWVTVLRRRVVQQTAIIRRQLEMEGTLKERYQDLFESANDMVYTHDLSGRITSINMAGERMLGRNRSFVLQRGLLDFIADEQRTEAGQWLADIIDGTAPAAVEWDFLTSAGERLRVEISTRLIEREGRQVEVEGIARDVTERRRLEREILEVSTREQRRIGHDLHDGICQQLAGISCLTDILAGKLDEQGWPEAAEAHKITSLLNEVNKQTRGVARGLFPVQLEENGLVSALEELAENAGTFFTIRCEFRCETPVAVRDHAVAHHLYFIAQEAIVNAVKHGKADLVELRLAAEGGHGCVLTIQDNGAGLASPPAKSRGMGIRIMKYRARLIGAEVQIRSRAAGGTEVVCWCAPEPQSPPSQLAASASFLA
ncbi:MAG TPA: PAS domain S-box protein [Candidatus Acidoferrum sp.]|jgi:PAS domain S-box-containing protein|nr:PAS domain S-box protein [Candidatus Acidoferrum sp.]